MSEHAQTVEYHIQITFPPNADRDDYEEILDELIGYAADHTGLGVDGWYREIIDDDMP